MFYVAIDGAEQGPMSSSELEARLDRGDLRPVDLCRRDGGTEWRRIDEVFPKVRAPLLKPTGAVRPAKPVRSVMAFASIILGLGTIAVPLLVFVFGFTAVVCGHAARSRIKRSKGALVGANMAFAGLVLGYAGVLLALPSVVVSVAVPTAKYNVEDQLVGIAMDNDARLISTAAQQYFMQTKMMFVEFSYDPATGVVGGPLAETASKISPGYTSVPERLMAEGEFQLEHRGAGLKRTYNSDGQRLP